MPNVSIQEFTKAPTIIAVMDGDFRYSEVKAGSLEVSDATGEWPCLET